MATLATDTKPFAPFEWMLALRYLRARRKEGFISVLAGFSFLGILLGVFTLITVMAVMNGFRKELFNKILGLNGHIIVHKIGSDDFENYDEAGRRLATIPGVTQVLPLVEGQAMASMPHLAVAGLVRGMRENDLKSVRLVGGNIRVGSLDGFDRQDGVAIGTRLASALRVNAGDFDHAHYPAGTHDALRHVAARQALQGGGHLRDGDVRVRPHHDLHAARRRRSAFSTRAMRSTSSRCSWPTRRRSASRWPP